MKTGLNATVARVLLIGLLVAITLLIVGVILVLVRPGLPLLRETSIQDMPRSLAAFQPDGFFTLGLLALVATPVARVVVLGVAFARRRQWMFCSFSIFVLLMLGLSAFFGLRG